jgi:MFS family permease
VAAVCFGAFMGQLDASIVTLTYRPLADDFGQPLGTVQWVSLSYLLVLAALLIPVGRLSDRQGRKLMYLRGFTLFTVASAACAWAPSLGWLIAFRALQAVGAALLQANSIALVILSVAPASQRAALGVQAAAQALGLALGPTVGGVLVEQLGWRSVFWVNIPIGLVALVAGRLMLPRSRGLAPSSGRDPIGFLLLAVTATAVLLALSGVSGTPLPGWTLAALVALAVAGGPLLALVESRATAPLVDPSVVRLPGVPSGLARALVGYLLLFAPLVLFPTVFTHWQLDQAQGGLALTALPTGFGVVAVAGNLLPGRIGNERRFVGGAVVTSAAYGGLAFAWTSAAASVGLLVALGAGLGLALPANNASVMALVPPSAAAVTGGQVNVARALGTSFGVALTTFGIHVAGLLSVAAPPLVLATLGVLSLTMAGLGLRPGHPPRIAGREPTTPGPFDLQTYRR